MERDALSSRGFFIATALVIRIAQVLRFLKLAATECRAPNRRALCWDDEATQLPERRARLSFRADGFRRLAGEREETWLAQSGRRFLARAGGDRFLNSLRMRWAVATTGVSLF